MPLGDFERELLRLLASNRNPDSFVAGATVLHQAATSPRCSRDIDLFHDAEQSLATSAAKDVATLQQHGYAVTISSQFTTFWRAQVTKDSRSTKIEWAFDSAFRFFPVEADAELGYRLNFWDAATNKVLALAMRHAMRDFLDVLYLDKYFLSLGAMAWAASGKDPGLTPPFILEEAKRTTHYTQADVETLKLVQPVSLVELKKQWLQALGKAEPLVAQLPPEEVGCLYLNQAGQPVTPDPQSPEFPRLTRHFGSIKGAWPVIRPD